MKILDGFLDSPDQARQDALAGTWVDYYSSADDETYKRIQPYWSTDLERAYREHFGNINVIASAFRLNYKGELPNALIHSDGDGWGKYAGVLYLSEESPRNSGTAFWRHRATGAEKLSPADYATALQVVPDWDDPSKFDMTNLVQAKFNRLVVYDSEQLHSRWPFEGHGSTPQDGRLTHVTFFS